jgi:hypothetical protein
LTAVELTTLLDDLNLVERSKALRQLGLGLSSSNDDRNYEVAFKDLFAEMTAPVESVTLLRKYGVVEAEDLAFLDDEVLVSIIRTYKKIPRKRIAQNLKLSVE